MSSAFSVYPLFMLFGYYSLIGVILSDALNSHVPSEYRATANSMISFAFR